MNLKAIVQKLKSKRHHAGHISKPVQFTPRPDRPELLDQQTSFYEDSSGSIIVGLGGNGSGKSFCGAAKVARFLTQTPPPEPVTPFWVLSQNMEMATSTCWGQNLSHFLTPEYIQDIVWYSQAKSQPRTVVLRPHGNGHRYHVEFKSYDQGRQALQGSNIIGFFADEQAPFPVLTELLARTRKWTNTLKLYCLTPIEPDMTLEEIVGEPAKWPDWHVYRFNTRLNDKINPDFVRQIEANEVDALIETRLTGAFARFEGAIYKEFDPAIHVIDPFAIPDEWPRIRAIDLGWSHATACVWIAVEPFGRFVVYREYLKAQTSIEDHVRAINDGWTGGDTYIDPANAQVVHEMELAGLKSMPAHKDVMAGIGVVQSLLRPGRHRDGGPMLHICRNCENTIRQMRSYVWDKTAKEKGQDKPKKVDDDLVDALRYACASKLGTKVQVTMLDMVEPAPQPTGFIFPSDIPWPVG